jgi:hypothetical protein
MVNRRLVDYLKKGLEKGYSLDSLKSLLLKHGFSEKDIDDSIKTVTKKTFDRKLLTRYFIVVILALTIFFFFTRILSIREKPVFNLEERLPIYKQWAYENYLKRPEYLEEINRCKAIVNQDVNLCNEDMNCIAEYRFVIAHLNNEEEECNKIPYTKYTIFEKNVCIASINHDISKCSDAKNKEICEYFVNGDISSCLKFQPEDSGDDCDDIYILVNKAIKNNDINECNNIKGSFTKETCVALLSGNEKNCTEERATYIAYSIMASEFKNSSFCEMIEFRDEKESCLNRLNCELIKNKREKEECLKEFR